MANVVNLDAETGANFIGDDSDTALRISNSSTGRALDATGAAAAAVRVAVTTGAANATAKAPLEIVGTSIASGAVIGLINLSSFVSTTTIKATVAVAANCGALRVVKPDGTFGWIPVYPDAAVTGVAL